MLILECGTVSLFSLIQEQPDIFQKDFGAVKKLFAQLYSAMTYLRVRNIGHRDLKPKNIIYFLLSNNAS